MPEYANSRPASTDGIRPSRPNLLPPILTIDSDDIDCISPALKRAFSASYLYEITSPSTTPPCPGEIESPLPRKSFPDITVLNDRRIPLSLSMSSLNLSLNRIRSLHNVDQQFTPPRAFRKTELSRTRSVGMFFLEQDDAESDYDELEAFRAPQTDNMEVAPKRSSASPSHKRIPSVKVNNLLRNPSLPLFVKMQDVPNSSDEPKTEPSSPRDEETSPLAEACAEFLEIVKNPPPIDYNNLVSPLSEQALACWIEEQTQHRLIS